LDNLLNNFKTDENLPALKVHSLVLLKDRKRKMSFIHSFTDNKPDKKRPQVKQIFFEEHA